MAEDAHVVAHVLQLPQVVGAYQHRGPPLAPILMEALPLTLEEIFIYELGGEDYAVRDIVL